ncbi:hypothetical protein ACNHKD_04805 [Methylocystis sp. JAN1]|uniref:hypothetical protein n=1 Tax=Methylocystis sp. JAN1 TaxID=3397211 RepID=UPI003FA1F041
MKILGLGHSHIVAVAKGCYELQHKGATIGGKAFSSTFVYLYDPQIMPTLVEGADGPLINPRLAEIVAKEDAIAGLLSVGGNEHIAMSVVQPREPIDFVLGEDPDLPLSERASIVPEAAIRETMREKMASTLATLSALRRATPVPLFCLEPPPPLPDARVLAYPKEFFRKAVDRAKLSSELFRYKMWRVQSALYRKVCAKEKIEFVSVPERFISAPGVLAEAAWGADASHANPLFGEAMVRKAIETMDARLAADLEK